MPAFEYQRRVAFSDTDAMQVMHHANYLRFCEEARVAWMRHYGLTEIHFPKTDLVLAVLHYQVWHFKPAQFEDLVSVRLQVRREKLKVRFQYSLYNKEELLAQAETLHIALNRALKPVRPHKILQHHLETELWTETWLLNS